MRAMPDFDTSLIKLFVDQLLLPHFEHSSTVVRKQVVTALAELKLAIEVRLKSDCALNEITF